MIFGTKNHSIIPFKKVHQATLGRLSNSVKTHPWANPGWNYFGKHAEKPVFGYFRTDGFGGSGRGGCHSLELVEFYLEHYVTQLEHLSRRIRAGITSGTISVPWGQTSIRWFSSGWVGRFGPPRMPFDRARRYVSGTLSNAVGTHSWANPGWKYRWYHQCPLVKIRYLPDCGRRVGAIANRRAPFDRARRVLLGTLCNSVGTPS